LEKNLAQHKADEKFMRYKLEAYQKKFLDFICGSLTNIKILCQDEKIEVVPSGTTQKEEIQIEESQDFKSGIAQEEEV
jgi:hypothetical protein